MKFPDSTKQHSSESAPLDIREYIYLINKHKWLIIFCLVVTTLLAGLWFLKQKKVWRSVSKIQVASGMLLPVPDVYKETTGSRDSYLRGQIEILNSRSLENHLKTKIVEAGWHKKLSLNGTEIEDLEEIMLEPKFTILRGTDIITIEIDSTDQEYALFYSNYKQPDKNMYTFLAR